MHRALTLLAALALVALAPTATFGQVEPQTSLADIEDEVMCPICGVTLELATEAPETEGFDLAAWIVPGLAILAAGVAIVFGLRRWRKAGRAGEEGGSARQADAMSDEDSARLEEDLARYEL